MPSTDPRIYLSPPRVTDDDVDSVVQAMRSGWVAPVGPALDGFESDMAAYLGVSHAVALSSGTAGLHLGLKEVGVEPGQAVLMPTVTFGATAFAATYLGADPVFVDIDESWNMDPSLTRKAIAELRAAGRSIGAAVPVDLYGTPANYPDLLAVFEAEGIPVVEDAAEGLGGTYHGRKLGTLGRMGVLSFNGNKLISTSGGGMVVTNDERLADRVRFLSTQSKKALPWYEHDEIGYNYRLSNVLAALGRSQLRRVDDEVERRRSIREQYRDMLEDIAGVTVQQDPVWGQSNAWLTVVRFDSHVFPGAPTQVRMALEAHDIESRPVWKPLHLQPVFKNARATLSGQADALFREGLCLPSGTGLSTEEVNRISSLVRMALGHS